MLTTRISSKGQMVVPKEVRDKLKIKPGNYFYVRLEKNNIILTPMKTHPLDRLYGRYSGEKGLTDLEKEHANEIAREDRT